MSQQNRRSFLKTTASGLTGAAAMTLAARTTRAAGANERVNVAIIGCGGRGTRLGKLFGQQQDVAVTHVCDPDRRRVESAQSATGARHALSDMRRIFDDKSVDAVAIATCDHWHAPAAILACRAGKHVYVEKPCSHNVREGRLMVDAAGEHRRVMQHGTQSRSANHAKAAVQMLRDGAIGDVLVAKHVNSQRRDNIGHQQPSDPPEYLDYEMWLGPASWKPYQTNFVHYHWHWFYNFGTGDIGNDGVHGIDVARWGLGVDTHPALATGYGSKLYFDDDQQFPDTYTITFEYPGDGRVGSRRLLVYEQRIWSPYQPDAEGNNVIFYGTEGMLTLGRKGIQVFGRDNELLRSEKPESPDDAHQRNFIDAIKSGDPPNADVEVGHLSSALCHLGNIVARTRRTVVFDPDAERIVGDEEADKLLRRKYRPDHWAVPAGA